MDPLQIQIAFAAGYDAASRNVSRTPCGSALIMRMVANNPDKTVGASIPLFKAFEDGFATRCTEEARALLAG